MYQLFYYMQVIVQITILLESNFRFLLLLLLLLS